MSRAGKKSGGAGGGGGGGGGFGSFLRMIFHRSNPTASQKRGHDEQKRATRQKHHQKLDFGIEETEKLSHFQRPRPPANRRRPRSTHPAALAKMGAAGGQEGDERKLSSELEEAMRKRSRSQAEVMLVRGDGRPLTAEERRKRMSKSVPELSKKVVAEEEENEDEEVVEEGSKKTKSLERKKEEESGHVRPFWLLVRKGSSKKRVENCDNVTENDGGSGGGSSSSGAEGKEEEEAEEEREVVEIRCKVKSQRSESLGFNMATGAVTTYQELIQAAHKSSPPLITN